MRAMRQALNCADCPVSCSTMCCDSFWTYFRRSVNALDLQVDDSFATAQACEKAAKCRPIRNVQTGE